MHILRPIRKQDNDSINMLALTASSGILTLPRNPERIKQKVLDSIKTFSSATAPYGQGKYFFALENLENHHVVGCSAIYAAAGIPGEEFYYKYETINTTHRPIDSIPAEQKILVPTLEPVDDTSEICTLYLSPTYQHTGIGRLLSLGRFLYIATHRERFKKRIMAELRGVCDDAGISPFWEFLGRHFCNIDFEAFMALYESKILQAQDILPKYPIYCSLLPQSIQDVLGKTHSQTVPALKLLQKEGFEPLDGVDICDGGPKLYADIDHVRAIKFAQTSKIIGITPPQCEQETLRPYFASNLASDFKACYAEVHSDENNGITLDTKAAKALQVTIGDSICYVKTKPL